MISHHWWAAALSLSVSPALLCLLNRKVFYFCSRYCMGLMYSWWIKKQGVLTLCGYLWLYAAGSRDNGLVRIFLQECWCFYSSLKPPNQKEPNSTAKERSSRLQSLRGRPSSWWCDGEGCLLSFVFQLIHLKTFCVFLPWEVLFGNRHLVFYRSNIWENGCYSWIARQSNCLDWLKAKLNPELKAWTEITLSGFCGTLIFNVSAYCLKYLYP